MNAHAKKGDHGRCEDNSDNVNTPTFGLLPRHMFTLHLGVLAVEAKSEWSALEGDVSFGPRTVWKGAAEMPLRLRQLPPQPARRLDMSARLGIPSRLHTTARLDEKNPARGRGSSGYMPRRYMSGCEDAATKGRPCSL